MANKNITLSYDPNLVREQAQISTSFGSQAQLKAVGLFPMELKQLTVELSKAKDDGTEQKIMLRGVGSIDDPDGRGPVYIQYMLSGDPPEKGPLANKHRITFFALLLKSAGASDLLDEMLANANPDVEFLNGIAQKLMTSGRSKVIADIGCRVTTRDRDSVEKIEKVEISTFSDAATYDKRRSVGGHRRPVSPAVLTFRKARESGAGAATNGAGNGVSAPPAPQVTYTVSEQDAEAV